MIISLRFESSDMSKHRTAHRIPVAMQPHQKPLRKSCQALNINVTKTLNPKDLWDFPKIRGPYFGVLMRRILLFSLLFGSPPMGKISRPASRHASDPGNPASLCIGARARPAWGWKPLPTLSELKPQVQLNPPCGPERPTLFRDPKP